MVVESPLEAATVEGHQEVADLPKTYWAIRKKEVPRPSKCPVRRMLKPNADRARKALERVGTF